MDQFKKRALLMCIAIIFLIGLSASAVYVRSRDPTKDCHGKNDPFLGLGSTPVLFYCGTMNGVRLAIPAYYIFGPIVYKSQIGLEEDSESTPNPDRDKFAINDFGPLLRLSNLKPVLTEQDQRDQVAATKIWNSTDWMMASYDVMYKPRPVDERNIERPRMVEDMGPYEKNPDAIFGLTHYESIQSVKEGDEKNYDGHTEYFYFGPTLTTIMCQTHRMKVPPFRYFDSCTDNFLIPSLHLMAEASYTKKDLPRWKEIEQRINDIAESFIQR